MKHVLGAVLLIALPAGEAPRASAGPWCGGHTGWAPAPSSTLPRRPRIVFWRQDTRSGARLPRIGVRATIGGARVEVATRDVRAGDVTLRFIEVRSDAAGELRLDLDDEGVVVHDRHEAHGIPHEAATYTIGPWARPRPTATIGRYHLPKATARTAHFAGLAVGVDAPAIAFAVRWRRDAASAWRSLTLPAVWHEGLATARIGQTECAADDVPLALLERGIELELTATLPDGTTARVEGLPGRVVVPPPP